MKTNRGVVHLFLLVIVIFIAIGAVGYLAYQNTQLKKQTGETIAPTESVVTLTPTPSVFPPTIHPTITTGVLPIKVELVSTSGWIETSFGSLSFKIPPQAKAEKSACTTDEPYTTYEECFQITGHDENIMAPPHISIKVKTYDGGSRRKEAGLTEGSGTYTYTEKLFGNNKGLEAIFDCKIDECFALRNIILVINNKLVFVRDGTYREGGNSVTLESPITNTIISTFK